MPWRDGMQMYAVLCLQWHSDVCLCNCSSGQLCDLLSRPSVELGQPWKNESYAFEMYPMSPMSYNLRVPSKCWKQQGFLTMELELVYPISFVVLVMFFQFVNSAPVCDSPIFIGMRLIVLQGCCTWNNKHPVNSVYEHWWGCSEPVSNGLI